MKLDAIESLQLAALLHHTTALSTQVLGPEGDKLSHSLTQALANWLSPPLIGAVQNGLDDEMTGDDALLDILHGAHHHAVAESPQTGAHSSCSPLPSLLSTLQLRPGDRHSPLYYRPDKLTPEAAFPVAAAELRSPQVDRQLAALGAELVKVLNQQDIAPRAVIARVLSLLEQYTWCLSVDGSDISLYDHLRATCAIAVALYRYREETGTSSVETVTDDADKQFLLVGGDTSGIQRYLFDIANIGVGGVAKRLRARSFFLSAISTGLVYRICADLRLSFCNILIQSGGNFYLLLPNTSQTKEYLAHLRREVNQQLYAQSGGELYLNLAAVPFAGREFSNYPAVSQQLRDLISTEKLRPLASLLQDEGGWQENSFLQDGPVSQGHGYCASCGKLPSKHVFEQTADGDTRYICDVCLTDVQVGRWLPRAKFLTLYTREPATTERLPLPGGIWVTLTTLEPKGNDALVVLQMNSFELPKLSQLPLRPYFIGNHVPLNQDGEVCDFGELASKAQGKAMLGVLKADVDNLGAMFAIGLGERGTISRVAMVSRMLELFFGGWLSRQLAENYPHVYLVYSGGDDLLAIGPWNEMFDVAACVQTEFVRFAGNNPNTSLSAGIALMKPRLPVRQGVESAEKCLQQSKRHRAQGQQEPKSQLTGLSATVKWSDVPALLQEATQVSRWLRDGIVSSAFIYRLLYYANLHDRYSLDQDTSGLKFIPLLSYDMARNLTKQETAPVKRWCEGLINDLDGLAIRQLEFIARYALLQRSEKSG